MILSSMATRGAEVDAPETLEELRAKHDRLWREHLVIFGLFGLSLCGNAYLSVINIEPTQAAEECAESGAGPLRRFSRFSVTCSPPGTEGQVWDAPSRAERYRREKLGME